MAKRGKDVPSPTLSAFFRRPPYSTSVAVCALLFVLAFYGVYVYAGIKKIHNRELVECHKKAWIIGMMFMAVYFFNMTNIVSVILTWFATLAYIGALVISLTEKRVKLYKFIMAAALGLTLLTWIIHWMVKSFTSLGKVIEIALKYYS